ncbi:ankyrin repeat domain-containing protein [Zooshikella ganghwensis]|uniref:Ankyrin repeat domain-containing protein n=1 Tax=Zooshikella ganghwensis TaxID=202772 RepID=A0A4P9VNB7_9GAMM|nr:ankyrin repeat domain-containing protein [Zooshikella ganghwensis]RDH44396.1 ankyrin repeat domain-containing protein [Zooshikella ganghwensis]
MTIKKILDQVRDNPEYSGFDDVEVNTPSLIGDTPIFSVIISGSLNDVQILIEAGADINYQGDELYTPLMQAIEFEKFDIAKYLIECGCNTSLKNAIGMTALDIALDSEIPKALEICKILKNNRTA